MYFQKERGSAFTEKSSYPCATPQKSNILFKCYTHFNEVDALNHEEPIQCYTQLMEEFGQLTRLLNVLQKMPEEHVQFQVTLARFLKLQL